MDDQQTGDTGFDIDSAVDAIGSSFDWGNDSDAPVVDEIDEIPEIPEETAPEEAPVEESVPAPASWAKDKHEFWAKMPKEAQEYYMTREKQMLDGLEQYKGDAGLGKQMKEVFTPYKAFLNAQGIDEPKAAQYLMNAHYKLTSAPQNEKMAYFSQLAKSYGIDLPGTQEQENVDPNVKALRSELDQLRGTITQQQQAAIEEQRGKVTKEIEAFAAENPYFDEVADDIVAHINAGATLQSAYEKAVWANPITRAKELARVQTETEASFKEKAKQEVVLAKKASSTNVRSRDTGKAPTEASGTMDDTMRDTLKKMRERT